jgi:hypothetical protein
VSNPRRKAQNFRNMLEDVLSSAFDMPLSVTLTDRKGESLLYTTESFLDLCEKAARVDYADKARENWMASPDIKVGIE